MSAVTAEARESKPRQELDSVVIRFAGDSGDGVQITGSQFTDTTALAGNDLATFPDFPAEIRAPIGTTFLTCALYQTPESSSVAKTLPSESRRITRTSAEPDVVTASVAGWST